MGASKPRDRSQIVYGWKGIAAALGCSPNTARTRAAHHGLPVRKVGGRYEAEKTELLAWLEEWDKNPVDGRLRPRVSARPSNPGNKKLLLGFASLALVAVFTAAAVFLVQMRGPEEIARVLVENRWLVAQSDEGRNLWRIPLPEILDEPVIEDIHYIIRDVDGDGRRDLIFIERKRNHKERTSRLHCFNEHGEKLWHFDYGRELQVGQRQFARTFEGKRVDWIEMERRAYILTIGSHKPWYPSQAVLLETSTGAVVGEYLHPGHLTDFALVNIDADPEDEIVMGGLNNPGDGPGRPVLFALDFPFPKTSVAESYFGPWSGRELTYLVFPEIDIYHDQKIAAAVRTVEVRPDGRILVPVGVESDRLLHYTFNKDLELSDVRPADGFVTQHETLYRDGDLDHPLEPERELAQWSRILRLATAPDANRLGEEDKPSG